MSENKLLADNHIVVFNDNKIRRVMHNNEWWFVVVDVIAALTGSADPSGYFKDMKRRDPELRKGGGANCHPPYLRDLGRQAKAQLRQYRRAFPFNTIHTFT